MARLALLIPILTLLCACVATTPGQEQLPTEAETPTASEATATPAEKPTDTVVPATRTPEDTPTPEASPTPEMTSTPTENPLLDVFFTMPKTLHEYPVGQKSLIVDILAKAKRGPSHLTEGSPPPDISNIVNNSGNLSFFISCNYGETINCAPVAFMQFQDQGLDIHIIFYEIRNMDGSSGWFVLYNYDSEQLNGNKAYPRLVANPTGRKDLEIDTGISEKFLTTYSYMASLFTPEYLEATSMWIETGNVPKPLNDGSMITPGSAG